MNDWRECKLSDAPFEIIDGDRGTNYPKQDEFSSAGYCLFLNAKNVTIDGFEFSECYFVSKEKDETLRKGKLQRNDIVLTTRGTVGNIAFYNSKVPYENIRINSGMVVIRPDGNGILPEYTYQLFKFLKRDFDVFATGSAQPQLPIRDLKEIDILLPPLPEQRAIASVLASMDDKIDLLNHQNKTLESMAETLWRKMFVEDADPNWTHVKMKEIIDVRDGTHDSPKQADIGFPLITSRHLKKEGIDFDNAYKISEEDYNQINKRSKVDKDDILFSMIGTIGLIHYIEDDPNFAIKNIGLFKSSKKPEFAKYLYLLLKSFQGRDFIYENSDGSTQEYVALGNLRSFSFAYPGDNVIQKFDEIIEPVFNKVFQNRNQIRTLSTLRDSLLPKLMSGEVRVNL